MNRDGSNEGDALARDAATLLSLMWLASPALPVGGFSYSEGLEAAVEARLVTTEDAAARWLADQLDLALARADLPLMLRALDAWRRADDQRAARLNDWVRRTRESAESRRQSEQMGRSLVEWLRNGGSGGGSADPRVEALAALAPAPTWPVAFALAAALAGAAPRDSGLAYAFGWAENMVQAAMKAVPLGQGAAQRLLGRLAAAMPAAVDAARAVAGVEADAARGRAHGAAGSGCTIDVPSATGPASDTVEKSGPGSGSATGACPDGGALAAGREPQAYAPMWAILSAQHESQYSRLFRS